ncbi:MAG TPA: hypothetical protein VGP46_09580, partial [Acidimicrobiales bacterium]|nr:hypothetical protein [Acidimicrobiales bacterium]
MSTSTLVTAVGSRPANGGIYAYRAVVRWAWRLFRHEWRQQALILALIVFAVGATIVGASVAINTPSPANTGFGSAQDRATFQSGGSQFSRQLASLQ